MLLPIFDVDGSPVDAHFEIYKGIPYWMLIFASRGGTMGSPSARNVDYVKGLELLIARAAERRVTVVDGFVDSNNASVHALSEDERRLSWEGLSFPLKLGASTDAVAIAALLRRAQRDVGSHRERGGGNTTRRIRLILKDTGESDGDLGALLTGPGALGRPSESMLEAAVQEGSAGHTSFEPSTLEDARRRVLAAIAIRQGQPAFRRSS
jgi:hypothetical protein